MRILLLGGSGFIGRHIASAIADDHHVTIYDIDSPQNVSNCEVIVADIRDDNIESLIANHDIVVDLIAYANPKLYVDVPLEVFNICFTENLNVAELCVKHNKRLIQFSTCEVYGDHGDKPDAWSEDETYFHTGPIDQHRWIYANAKQVLERLLHIHGEFSNLEYTIIRPFNFIGYDIDYMPSEQQGCPRVFSHFVDSIRGNGSIKLVNGGMQRRAYTHITDAVNCIKRIINHPVESRNQVFNIGSPDNETTIKDLANLMIDIALDEQWVKWPPQIESVSGKDFYGKGYADITRRVPNITKAQTILGWQPTMTLRDTLYESMRPWFTS